MTSHGPLISNYFSEHHIKPKNDIADEANF
jgi:hypothetical protein